jgi:Concanavalin A-like lectin/glucanases superfamily/PEP-CTERM motif
MNAKTLTSMALLMACAALTPVSQASPILWNKLGSTTEVLNSAYGPNLSFYGGGSWPDVIANPGFVPGMFGNALTIGAGSYGTYDREHNVVWNNLNQYLNPDHGTIEAWYKQNENPVGFSYGVYRIFDGSYGLGAGIGLDSEAASPGLNFGLSFGGASSGVSYDITAFNGTWIHVAGVWDRAGIAGSNDKIRLYINGNLVAANTTGGWGTAVGQQADIGGGNDGGIAGKFAVDNLQVFDTALTDFSGRFNEAVPEPGTLSLAALGVLVLCRRRR